MIGRTNSHAEFSEHSVRICGRSLSEASQYQHICVFQCSLFHGSGMGRQSWGSADVGDFLMVARNQPITASQTVARADRSHGQCAVNILQEGKTTTMKMGTNYLHFIIFTNFWSYPTIWMFAKLEFTAAIEYRCFQDFGFIASASGGGRTCSISFQCRARVARGVCSINSTSSSMKNLPIWSVGSVAYIIPLNPVPSVMKGRASMHV